jgi:hypothetical protein
VLTHFERLRSVIILAMTFFLVLVYFALSLRAYR